jgi:hypothetical protein
MLPEKNRLEKICIQDKKIEDIRIVYEEYSIDKIIKKSYQNLLKVRNHVLNKRQMSTKGVKDKNNICYYSVVSKLQDINFQYTLYDLSPGQVSNIIEEKDKFVFIKLKKYEVLGNDKKDITKLEELYRDMSAEIYIEKVHTDLFNYFPIQYSFE